MTYLELNDKIPSYVPYFGDVPKAISEIIKAGRKQISTEEVIQRRCEVINAKKYLKNTWGIKI